MDIITLLKTIVENGSSDLIITEGAPPMLRENGSLYPADQEVLTTETAKALIYSLLSKEQIQTFEMVKELDVSYALKGQARFRLNVHYQKGSVAAALRLIPTRIPSLDELNLPPIIKDFSNLERGLVLVTGPTGAGKTTTQACIVDLINSNKRRHIITIEDPIEYVHMNKKCIIEQREVGVDTDSFNSALKRVLRQNPDVILIGEMRDLETIQTAITAAETGHLVISTLHTNDAVQSIDRIIDVFPPHQQSQIRLQLSLCMQAIVAQQLIPRLDEKGMISACEVLVNTAAVKNLIRKAQSQEIYSMLDIGSKFGMQSMDASLKNLYTRKLVSYEEALSHALNPEHFEKI